MGRTYPMSQLTSRTSLQAPSWTTWSELSFPAVFELTAEDIPEVFAFYSKSWRTPSADDDQEKPLEKMRPGLEQCTKTSLFKNFTDITIVN